MVLMLQADDHCARVRSSRMNFHGSDVIVGSEAVSANVDHKQQPHQPL